MLARRGVEYARPERQWGLVLAGEGVLVFAESLGVLVAAGGGELLHQRVIGQDQVEDLVGLGLQGAFAEEEIQGRGVAVMGELQNTLVHRV